MNILTKYSSTLANDTSYGSSPWFNIVSTPNTNSWGQSHAQTSDLNLNTSNYLKCTNFGFSIPSVSVIVGITVEVHVNGSSNTETINSFRLVKNNVVVGSEKGDDSLVNSTVPKVFGNSSDLWGTTWTAADINNVNFGLVLACEGYTSGSVVSLIGARITINYISSQHSYVANGSLYLSKFGSIDENFSVDFGQLIQSNLDSGYSVNTGANIVSGYVTRDDDYPSGYASPAMLYASCASNFDSEIKFVCPSEYTGDGSPNTSVYLFYRIKNNSNYRLLKISWVYDIAGPYKFIFDDQIIINDAVTSSTWSSIPSPTARKNDVVIFKLKVINNKLQIKFNNLNSLDSQTIERDLFYSTVFSSECGVGFGCDSNERLRYITSIPSAVSFKTDYFKALSTSYESLGLTHNPSGSLTLSGTSLAKFKHKLSYTSNGSLTVSGSALFRVPRIGITGFCTGGLILGGTSTDQNRRKCIASGGIILSGTVLTNVPRRAYFANGTLLLGSSTLTNSSKRNYTSSGSLVLSNTFSSKLHLKYVSTGSFVLNGSNTPYRRFKLTSLGGLTLSKVGVINEDFSINFGALKNSNSDAGYSVIGAGNGGQIGDGSGGLSYNGYVIRNDVYPSGYASPAILYAPSSSNFTAEIKFVCPSESNNAVTDFNISLFYRYKDNSNYRELRFIWYYQAFSIADVISNSGSLSTTYIYTVPLAALKQSYIILKFKIVNDQIQIIFNNLNTLFVTTHQHTMQSPSFLANEGGVGFGFDSNEKLVYYNTTPGSLTFRPDYFKVANIPYENLGGKFNTNGGLTLSGSSLCRIKYAQTSDINLILSGTAITKTPSVQCTGGLTLSKVGIINEDFSVNFGVLKNSNSDAGYSVLGTGNGGQTGDGSGGLIYDGYVVRSDAYPSGYAVPAALYAPSSPNFTAEIKFVCPSEITGSLADVSISLFYRYKNSSNYRELRFGWYYVFSNNTSRFYIDDIVSNNGVISNFSWFGIPPLIASKQSYIILKFRIVNDQIQVIFNNLNTLDVVIMQQTMTNSSFLANEGGIGFGFDSNEKLKHVNLDISSTSFKPDYFKVANIPYENLGGKFNTNGGLTLSGSSPIKIALSYVASGSLQLSGDSISATKSAKFILDGNLILSGQAICIAKDLNYSIDFINNPLILNGSSIIEYKTNHQYASDGTLLIGGDSNEFYRINYVTFFNGGLILGGTALVNYQTKYTFNGGLILGGTALVNYQTKYTFNGGLILGGTAAASNKVSYHVISSGGLILGGNSNAIYKTNYYVLSSGGLILGGNSSTSYKFVYKYQPTNFNLILSSSNLIKYSINLRYLLNNGLLTLFGKAKGKNRLLINNSSYVSNNISVNEVKLISTKKEDIYLQWQLENNVVISKFANK